MLQALGGFIHIGDVVGVLFTKNASATGHGAGVGQGLDCGIEGFGFPAVQHDGRAGFAEADIAALKAKGIV